ncbi:hypothetical protein MAR_017385 [Mya arenaria]|uniref:Uncharacterized protein n=1 Tax=Mya arenaria TaxID=6604 RepID=A0ABY7EES6_MYAAR|nr:hypothetical protein MAR_017385 [Mya arenaria]
MAVMQLFIDSLHVLNQSLAIQGYNLSLETFTFTRQCFQDDFKLLKEYEGDEDIYPMMNTNMQRMCGDFLIVRQWEIIMIFTYIKMSFYN